MRRRDVTMIAYLELLDTPEEKAAFQTLYEMYVQKMYQIAFRITGNEVSAEDMVHETFLSLTKHMDKLDNVQSRRTWNYILTALKHHCFDLLEKQKQVVPYCDEDDVRVPGESGAPHLKTATKKISRTTFTAEDTSTARKGARLLPTPRSTAE